MAIAVKQLGGTFFAEVTNVRLSGDIAESEIGEIWDAFHEYAVLLFPGQNLDDPTQLAFSQRLGPLMGGTFRINRRERIDTTYLADLSNIDPKGGLRDPSSAKMRFTEGNKMWHTDSSFERVPALASLLSAREVPPTGGETEWTDLRAAWDELPEDQKAGLEDLIAVHSLEYSRSLTGYDGFNDEERAAWPPAEQAVVRVHEATGRKNLYLGAHASHLVGWDVAESRALLKELTEFATQERFTYMHSWTSGDMVMWDNRCTLHRGHPWEAAKHRRDMRRSTVAGHGPTVADGKPVDEYARAHAA